MKTRMLTALGMAVIGIPIIIFSKWIVFPIALALLSVVATFEMMRVFGVHKKLVLSLPAYIIAAAMPILSYFDFARGEGRLNFLLIAVGTLFVYLIYLFFVAVFMRGELKYSVVSEIFTASLYVISSFTAISVMRYMTGGIWFLVMLLVAAWGSDTFAYFTGMLFGKHKLIPEISPKKTIEGSVGGIVCATLLMTLFGFLVGTFTSLTPNYLVLVLSGLILSAASQVGDLIASLIKRENGIKDYGRVFPGHGGVMDRFDSVLSIATALMIICIIAPPFA